MTDGVFLLYHRCSLWCRPAEKVHGLVGYGTGPYEKGDVIETLWGSAAVEADLLAEAPPDGQGRPATMTLLRFVTPFAELPEEWGGDPRPV